MKTYVCLDCGRVTNYSDDEDFTSIDCYCGNFAVLVTTHCALLRKGIVCVNINSSCCNTCVYNPKNVLKKQFYKHDNFKDTKGKGSSYYAERMYNPLPCV